MGRTHRWQSSGWMTKWELDKEYGRRIRDIVSRRRPFTRIGAKIMSIPADEFKIWRKYREHFISMTDIDLDYLYEYLSGDFVYIPERLYWFFFGGERDEEGNVDWGVLIKGLAAEIKRRRRIAQIRMREFRLEKDYPMSQEEERIDILVNRLYNEYEKIKFAKRKGESQHLIDRFIDNAQGIKAELEFLMIDDDYEEFLLDIEGIEEEIYGT